MQQPTESYDLTNILNRFDPSARDKFERSADAEWCGDDSHGNEESASKASKSSVRNLKSRLLCTKSKFVRRVAKKMDCMKNKLPKRFAVTPRIQKAKASIFSDEITRGSNTPANSRPSSISIPADKFDQLRRKQSPPCFNEGSCSATTAAVGVC